MQHPIATHPDAEARLGMLVDSQSTEDSSSEVSERSMESDSQYRSR